MKKSNIINFEYLTFFDDAPTTKEYEINIKEGKAKISVQLTEDEAKNLVMNLLKKMDLVAVSQIMADTMKNFANAE